MTLSGSSQRDATALNAASGAVGDFVFSLDTELAWGDLWNQSVLKRPARDGAVERANIRRLLDLMAEYGVVGTWAITGHLFYQRCEECDICPIASLQGKDHRFDQIWKTDHPMWYGADIVDMIRSSNAAHEVGFHGYTHRTFDKLSRDEARLEIEEWLRLATRKGIVPRTVIFPQGRIRHLDLFREMGFASYRGREVMHPVLRIPLMGKVLNKVNLKLALLAPQPFRPSLDSLGLLNVPGSLWLFRTNRKVESALDFFNLHTARLRLAARSIRKAANERKTIHFWLHPQELRTEKDFAKIRFLFEQFAQQAQAGKLRSITMGALANEAVSTPSRRAPEP